MQKLTTASIVTICVLLASAGPLAAQQPSNLVRPGDRIVRFTVTLPDTALRVDAISPPVDPATGAAEGEPVTRVDLEGVGAVSRPELPGEADLPSLVRLVAVPRTARIVALRVVPRETREIANVALVTWAQTPRPGQVVPPRDPAEPPPPSETGPWYSPGPPDPMPAGYLDAERWPADTARAVDVRRAGAVGIAQVLVTPVEWHPRERRLLFHRVIDVELVTRGGRFPERVSNFAQAESIRLLATSVVNPGVLPQVPASPPAGPQRFPYLIVTDNVTWNARAIQPLLPVQGDLVGELQALATWRTKTGLNARVVTVSDVVSGVYGQFRQPWDPDLQAVIRRFLQFAQREWGTYYVLLGGDIGIVPTRIVTTAAAGNGAWWNFKYVGSWPVVQQLPPIEAGQCAYVTSDRVILRQDASLPVQDSTLLIANGQGLALARVSSPTPNAPGWTYLAPDLSESAVPTEYILVRAPAAALGETNVMAQTADTEIPTDFYYASLGTTPAGRWLQQEFPWLPDWDVNGNGLFGQAAFRFDVDGVTHWPDLAVGRAPVRSAKEARDFVAKVIDYERHGSRPADFGRRAVFAQRNWGGTPELFPMAADKPLQPGRFKVVSTEQHLLDFGSTPAPLFASMQLVRLGYGGGATAVPYSAFHAGAGPTWRYCSDASCTQPAQFPQGNVLLPLPTRWVSVRGTGMTDPYSYYLDGVGLDGAAQEKQAVRALLSAWAPGVDLTSRLYQEAAELPPAPDLAGNSQQLLLNARWSGVNLLSLSGHGDPVGCCGLEVSGITAFLPTGLVYADSCLTNAFTQDALGPLMVRSPNGAVSYVGNSRWSWIGSGAIKEQTFWDVLTQAPILGIAHNSKSLQVTNWVDRWQDYTLNLMGDPAMSIWLGSPSPTEILAPAALPVGDPFTVRAVTDTGTAIGGALVTVSSARRGVIANGRTNADGVATLGVRARPGEVLDVVVTAPGAAPAETTVAITQRR